MWEGEEIFFLILFSSFLSQIYENRTVGIRQIKNESALRDEGYAWVPKKHGISPRIQVKVRKILIFSFSQIYGVLMVGIFRTKS